VMPYSNYLSKRYCYFVPRQLQSIVYIRTPRQPASTIKHATITSSLQLRLATQGETLVCRVLDVNQMSACNF